MEPNEAFRYLGLFSLFALIGGISYIIRRWGTVGVLSLSKHAARQQQSRWIFAVTLTLSVVLFGLYGLGWLVPTLHLGGVFAALLGLALACALVAGLIPDTGKGWQGRVHAIAAWTMAACMPVLLFSLLFAPAVSTVARFFLTIILSYLIFDWILFTFARWSHKFFVFFQASYVFCFYLAMIVAAV